jgi:hypothetical protein
MRLTSKDFEIFSFCPYLWASNIKKIPLEKDFSSFEKTIIQTIKKTELACLLKDSEVTNRKLIRQWDNTWWPTVIKNRIPIKEAQDLSVHAAKIFTDYCKYEVTDLFHPTAGVDIEKEIQIGRSIVSNHISLLKIDLNIKEKNLIIIEFGKETKTSKELALNLNLLSKIYSFYNSHKIIKLIYIVIDSKKQKLLSKTISYRREDFQQLKKTLDFIESGISKKVSYMNFYNCWRCNYCQTLE